jgi:hypothetical protein
LRWRIRRDPEAKNYTDIAISPAALDDNKVFELYRRTGAEQASSNTVRDPAPEGAAL